MDFFPNQFADFHLIMSKCTSFSFIFWSKSSNRLVDRNLQTQFSRIIQVELCQCLIWWRVITSVQYPVIYHKILTTFFLYFPVMTSSGARAIPIVYLINTPFLHFYFCVSGNSFLSGQQYWRTICRQIGRLAAITRSLSRSSSTTLVTRNSGVLWGIFIAKIRWNTAAACLFI